MSSCYLKEASLKGCGRGGGCNIDRSTKTKNAHTHAQAPFNILLYYIYGRCGYIEVDIKKER